MLSKVTFRATFVAVCTLLSASAYAIADTPKQVNIPAGDLSVALLTLSKQSGADLVYRPEQLHGVRTRGAHGTFTTEQAVTQLLQGTALEARTDPSGAMLIAPPVATAGTQSIPKKQSTQEAGKKSSQDFRVAQVDQAPAGPQAVEDQKEAKVKLEEIVVTGTHIHGATSTASPTSTFTREDIDQSGLGTIADFVERLPQNWAQTSDSIMASAGGGGPQNIAAGTGVNFRGLGSDSTLVLLNGHRIAPGSNLGDFVDISLIPLAPIERIETVTDGASAIYGSDAVGGVMNMITRRSFDGVAVQLRDGLVTRGNTKESEASLMAGTTWEGGSALVSYEYFDHTPLFANSKSFTSDATEPTTLVPQQIRRSVFASASQTLTPDIELFADGLYARKTVNYDLGSPFFTQNSSGPVQTALATLGIRARIFDRFNAELSSSYTSSRTDIDTNYSYNSTYFLTTHSSIASVDAQIDGPLVTLPTGTVLLALGTQYRGETFESTDNVSSLRFDANRHVGAVFGEVDIPLLGPEAASTNAANRLELNVAGRYEHYSDFGSTNNPKIGLTWRPVGSVRVRGTYGTSFKAPLLHDLNPIPSQVTATPQTDPISGASVNTLIVFGGNPDLQAQKASTWTAGLDFEPVRLEGFRASFTYYNIDFKDRITNPSAAGLNVFSNALGLENFLGPQIIQRNPSASLVQALESEPTFTNFGVTDLSAIGAVVDSRQQNLATVKTSGIDGDVAYRVKLGAQALELGVFGTHILKFQDQVTATTPVVSILDTPYNPVGLRLRGRAVYTVGGFTGAGFLNFVDSYKDNRPVPTVPVASWTTADLTVGYAFGDGHSALSDSSLTLSVVNITDRPPPFVVNGSPTVYPGLNFDGTNANPLGRFISIQLGKRW